MVGLLLAVAIAAPPVKEDTRSVLRRSGCQTCHDSAVSVEHTDALEQFDLKDPKWSDGMTDRQLRDECMTLFLAGHETTALALTWAWYLLTGHPEVEARLLVASLEGALLVARSYSDVDRYREIADALLADRGGETDR